MRGCGPWILLLVLVNPAGADPVDGIAEQLLEWQESPLDLLEADVSELALLPGLDADRAEAIRALRDLGRLGDLEDLTQVPGLEAAEVEALRPYVRVGRTSLPLGATWTTLSQRRGEDGGRTVHRFTASGPRVHVSGVLTGNPQRMWRAAAHARHGPCEVLAGHLRVGRPQGLFHSGAARSRLAPASRPRAGGVRARTDSSAEAGWAGAAVGHRAGFLFAGRGGDGAPVAGGAIDLRVGTMTLTPALRIDGQGHAGSLDLVRDEIAWLGLTMEREARAARMGMRLGGQHWRAGADASAADGPLRHGVDPVSGHRLDRAHRCLQLSGRVRGTGWHLGVLWRDLARGEGATVATAEIEGRWRRRTRGRIEEITARVRVVPQRRLTLRARRLEGGREWRVRFSREVDGTGRSEVLGGEIRVRTGRQQWRWIVAGMDGSASRLWMFARSGTGVYPVWVRPPGGLLGASWGLEAAGMALGAWVWLRVEADRGPGPGVGMVCTLRAG